MTLGKEREITRRQFTTTIGSLILGAALGKFAWDHVHWEKEQAQIETERAERVRALLADTLQSSKTENLDLFEPPIRQRLVNMIAEKKDDLFSANVEDKERSRWEITRLAFVSYARSPLSDYDQAKEGIYYREYAPFLEKVVDGIGLDDYNSHSIDQVANTWIEACFRSMAAVNFSERNDPTAESVTITYRRYTNLLLGDDIVLGEIAVPLQKH